MSRTILFRLNDEDAHIYADLEEAEYRLAVSFAGSKASMSIIDFVLR